MALNVRQHISLIDKYSEKYETKSPTKLAKILIREEKLENTIESLRKGISLYLNGKMTKFKRSPKNNSVDLEEVEIDLNIPKSYYEEDAILVLPKKCDNILYIGDLHIPYHSIESIRLALKYAKNKGVNTIYINGDLLDCYQISRFRKDPEKLDLLDEIGLTTQFLRNLRNVFPDESIYYKIGNHEERFENLAKDKVPELWKAKAIRTLPELLECKELGIEIVKSKQLVKAGKLFVIHGHEYNGSGQINIARGLLLKSQDNILSHHYHRSQHFDSKPINDKPLGAWSVGCLSGLKPAFCPLNNWVNGFAHQVIESDETFTLYNKTIISGQIR